jgi:hypothetical protein
MRSDGEIQTSVTERESECALQRQTFSFTSPEKDFFLYSWCDYFTGKRKTLCTILLRYIRYVSSDWRQFHPHMHACTYCVCGRACVRACGQACVCVCQADTHPQQQSICRRRSWCRQSSLRYMYTRYHTQQRAELDRVPFYFMNFSPTVTSNMCRGT